MSIGSDFVAVPVGPMLAVETATRSAYVGIFDVDGQPLALAHQTADRHSAGLLTLCDRLFHQTQLSPKHLAAIACGAGPGSFTGLRVGMAMAKGLALPFNTPLLLVSSLHTLACDLAALPEAETATCFVPCIDAGKGELHAQLFSPSAHGPIAQEGAWRLSPEALCERVATLASNAVTQMAAPAVGALVLMGGPGLGKFSQLGAFAGTCPHGISVKLDVAGPSAVSLAALAHKALAQGNVQDLATSAPTYGRLPDITQPKRKIVGPGDTR